jgi:nucleoside-diphosphate-sugar epimerase
LKTIVVTGANGMLGRHIVLALKQSGCKVIKLTRNDWDMNNWNKFDNFNTLIKGSDAVIHAGASVPTSLNPFNDKILFDVNIRATLNIAEWSRDNKIPFVYVSGAIVYGDFQKEADESNELRWNGFGGFYGLSKLLAEDLLRREEALGLELSIIRPSSIYGYGLGNDKLISSFLKMAKQYGVITINEPVNDCIDFIHAYDVATAIDKIIKYNAWNTFNISSGKCLTIYELAKICAIIVGNTSVKICQDIGKERDPISRFKLNSDLAKKQLNWEPIVDMHNGMQMTYDKKIFSRKIRG